MKKIFTACLGKIRPAATFPADDWSQRFDEKTGADSIGEIWSHASDNLNPVINDRSNDDDAAFGHDAKRTRDVSAASHDQLDGLGRVSLGL